VESDSLAMPAPQIGARHGATLHPRLNRSVAAQPAG
jgi:hypothetical protein